MGDIDEVKSRLNIVDVVGARVQLKKAGRNFRGLCPFHNEKTPSFMVSPDRQIFHCFGCGKGGSVIDFVMEYEHVDFSEALETLAQQAGVTLSRSVTDSPEGNLKRKIYEVNHLASEYYHFVLTGMPLGEKARQYLKGRGVTDKTIKTFMLGYSPNSWEGLRRYLEKKGYDRDLIATAGLTVSSPRGGYDRFRGRVMFTLRDHRGNVVGFSGRLLDPDAHEAKYINTSETPVYVKSNVLYGLDVTKAAVQKENEAILMEGEFDVISAFQAGIGNAVAIKGSALTEAHVRLLRRFTERLTFALDSDIAGDAAARRGIEIAEKAGLDLKVVSLTGGKDPDEAVRENPGGFKDAVKNAVPIYDYFISSAVRRFDGTTAFGKKKISNELLPILNRIENPIIQAHYAKELSQVLGVSESSVLDGMRKVRVSATVSNRINPAAAVSDGISAPDRLELYLLAMLLQTRTADYFDDLKGTVPLSDFRNLPVRQILEKLDAAIATGTGFSLQNFTDSIPNELLPVFDQALLWDLSAIIEDDELVAREWYKLIREMRKSVLRAKIREVTQEVKKLDNPDLDDEKQKTLQNSLTQLTVELRALEKSATL